MNIADEGTTAHLKAIVQDHSKVAAICEQSITQLINETFSIWGLPKRIKIDNGHPFVTPGYRDVPTKSKMWWIGLGIEVIQNQLRCPQQNGAVECLQGIMKNWSNPKVQENIEQLQQRLDQESDFQRNHYQIPAKANKTRSQLHPELNSNDRVYDPNDFKINRVYDFLAQQVWQRSINANGNLCIMGIEIYISYKLKKQAVTITFDPIEKQWLVRDEKGTLLKTETKGVPTEKEIKDFALSPMNKDTT